MLEHITGFQWDDGNIGKNWAKHGVLSSECEEVFFNRPLLVTIDEEHSDYDEDRYLALGRTNHGSRLFIVFTIRGQLIRVISARKMTRKERRRYPA